MENNKDKVTTSTTQNASANDLQLLKSLQFDLIRNKLGDNLFNTKIDASTPIVDLYDIGTSLMKVTTPGQPSIFKQLLGYFNPTTLYYQIDGEFKLHSQTGVLFTASDVNRWEKICQDNENFMREKGENYFYIGFPYVRGIVPGNNNQSKGTALKTNSVFLAPLFLWKAKISVDENPTLSVDATGDFVSFNAHIFEMFNVFTNKSSSITTRIDQVLKKLKKNFLSDFEQRKSDIFQKWCLELFAVVSEEFKNGFGIDLSEQRNAFCTTMFQMNIQKFIGIDQTIINKMAINNKGNKAEILPYFVAGIFPDSDTSIYNDYSNLINDKSYEGPKFINWLKNLKNDEIASRHMQGNFQREGDIVNIQSLDYPQKSAVLHSLNDSIVIEGPPGTGKSQTISNIIANIVHRKKSCLFVVEKKVAADVVYERLDEIRTFCLRLFNDQNINSTVISSFQNVLKTIGESIGVEQQKKIINDHFTSNNTNIGNYIDEQFSHLKTLYDVMSDPRGNRYPEYQFKYLKGKEIYDTYNNLISLWIRKSNDVIHFWKLINEIVVEYEDFDAIRKEIIKLQMELKAPSIIDAILSILFNPENKAFFSKIQYGQNADSFTDLINKKIIKQYRIMPNTIETIVTWFKNATKAIYTPKAIKGVSSKKSSFRFIEAIAKNNTYDIKWYKNIEKNYFRKEDDLNNQWHNDYANIREFIQLEEVNSIFDYDLLKNHQLAVSYISENNGKINAAYSDSFNVIDGYIKDKYKADTCKCISEIKKHILSFLDHKKKGSLYDKYNQFSGACADSKNIIDIKWYLHEYGEIISLLFPVIVCTPDTVSDYIPLKKGIFDYVIFDESSQLPLERALPALYRGQNYIVVGDTNQLPPDSFFNKIELNRQTSKSIAVDSFNNLEIATLQLQSSASLLQYMKQKLNNHMLTYHYRSKHQELIQFNNVAFYNNHLDVIDDPDPFIEPCIECLDVNGVYEDEVNDKEVEVCLEKALEIVKNSKKDNLGIEHNNTLGIITFSRRMRDYIISKIYSNPRYSPIQESFDWINQIDKTFEGTFVKVAEDVQGEERNNILVVFGFSTKKSAENKVPPSFSMIIGEKLSSIIGANYINVIFSRAKEKLIIVKSFDAYSLPIDHYTNGAKILIQYLRYAQLISSGVKISDSKIQVIFNDFLVANNVRNYQSEKMIESVIRPKFGFGNKLQYIKNKKGEDDIEGRIILENINDVLPKKWLTMAVVYDLLTKIDLKNYEIIVNHREGKLYLDVCIRHIESKKIMLAIICNDFNTNELDYKEIEYYYRSFLNIRKWTLAAVNGLIWCNSQKQDQWYLDLENLLEEKWKKMDIVNENIDKLSKVKGSKTLPKKQLKKLAMPKIFLKAKSILYRHEVENAEKNKAATPAFSPFGSKASSANNKKSTSSSSLFSGFSFGSGDNDE